MRYLVTALLGLLLAAPAAGQITLDDYLGPAGTDYWRLGCRLRGAETECAAIDTEIEQMWVNSCPERVAPIPSRRLNIIRYRMDFERNNQGRTLAYAVGVWGPCRRPTQPIPGARRGVVRSAGGGAITDDDGEFLALGATFFPVVYWERTDPARLDADLAFLRSASRGAIDYVRILGTFGGECSTYWGPIRVDPEAADYRRMLARAIDHVYRHGMRVQITIFGGDCSNKPRRETINDVLAVVNDGRQHKVMALELVNEGWQVEYSDRDQIRADTRYLLARTQLLVAPTAWSGQTCDEWLELYAGLGATLFTVHHDRATNTIEGGWRPPRQPWELTHCTGLPAVASSNEPIGPGSSVSTESDPFKLVAGAVVSYIAGHAMAVFHSSAGVRGDVRFSALPNIRVTLGGFAAMKGYLPPDLVRWTHQNSHWACCHPFEKARTWPDDGVPGVVKSYAAVSGNSFGVLPMGIKGGADLTAKRDMTIRLIDPLTGVQVHTRDLDEGETFRVNDDWPAIWVEGEWR